MEPMGDRGGLQRLDSNASISTGSIDNCEIQLVVIALRSRETALDPTNANELGIFQVTAVDEFAFERCV